MSMPQIRRISQMMDFNSTHSEWILWTSKNKIIHVKYDKGELICRHDNKHDGRIFFTTKTIKDKRNHISTEEMLEKTRFKLNNDTTISEELLEYCRRSISNLAA